MCTLYFDSLDGREVLSLTALKVQLGDYLVERVAQLHLVADCRLELTLVLLGIHLALMARFEAGRVLTELLVCIIARLS